MNWFRLLYMSYRKRNGRFFKAIRNRMDKKGDLWEMKWTFQIRLQPMIRKVSWCFFRKTPFVYL